MKRVLWMVAMCALLQACSTAQILTAANQRPAGCEKSVIYDHVPAPKLTGGVILITVSELAKTYPSARPYLMGAIDAILDVLKDDKVTYAELAMRAAQQLKWVNSYFGIRLLAYSDLIAIFDQPIPIYACDRDLIKAHLTKQSALLELGAMQ